MTDLMFHLPIQLKRRAGVESLLKAMEDHEVRRGLKERDDLPASVKEIVEITEDAEFGRLARAAATSYQRYLAGKAEMGDVREAGNKLREYTQNTFPAGLRTLEEYATQMSPQVLRGSFAVNFDVAANAEAVVNAAIYTDVAVATKVALAAVAVAVVAVVVS